MQKFIHVFSKFLHGVLEIFFGKSFPICFACTSIVSLLFFQFGAWISVFVKLFFLRWSLSSPKLIYLRNSLLFSHLEAELFDNFDWQPHSMFVPAVCWWVATVFHWKGRKLRRLMRKNGENRFFTQLLFGAQHSEELVADYCLLSLSRSDKKGDSPCDGTAKRLEKSTTVKSRRNIFGLLSLSLKCIEIGRFAFEDSTEVGSQIRLIFRKVSTLSVVAKFWKKWKDWTFLMSIFLQSCSLLNLCSLKRQFQLCFSPSRRQDTRLWTKLCLQFTRNSCFSAVDGPKITANEETSSVTLKRVMTKTVSSVLKYFRWVDKSYLIVSFCAT